MAEDALSEVPKPTTAPEVKPIESPKTELLEPEFNPVTTGELDFLSKINDEGDAGKKRIKETPDDQRYQDIDNRRKKELDTIDPPDQSYTHIDDKGNEHYRNMPYENEHLVVPKGVGYEELKGRLEKVKRWNNDWNGLSNEDKLSRYTRIESLTRQRNVEVPTDEEQIKRTESSIAKVEERQKRLQKALEESVKSYDAHDLSQLQEIISRIKSQEQIDETWSSIKGREPEKYARLKAAETRYEEELKTKEPPRATEQSHFNDGKPVKVSFRIREEDLESMSTADLKDLLQRSQEFQKQWNDLSNQEKVSQYERVKKLKGSVGMEHQATYEAHLKDGETIGQKAIELWTNSLTHQINTLEEQVPLKEEKENQENIEKTESSIDEEAAKSEPAQPNPEDATPQPQEPTKKPGLINRIFRRG